VQRTFVSRTSRWCARRFNGNGPRDWTRVYKTEEINKSEYDEGMKKYRDGNTGRGAWIIFFVGKRQIPKGFLNSRTSSLSSFAGTPVEGGRGQLDTANTECNIELEERAEKIFGNLHSPPVYKDAMTVAQAEGLLADVALEWPECGDKSSPGK